MRQTHSLDQVPSTKAVAPDADEQARVLAAAPLDRPVHGRLEVVVGNIVRVNVLDALEVLDKGLELVVAGDHGLGVDALNTAECEENSLLAERGRDSLAAILHDAQLILVRGHGVFGLVENVVTGLDDHDTVLGLELGLLDNDIVASAHRAPFLQSTDEDTEVAV